MPLFKKKYTTTEEMDLVSSPQILEQLTGKEGPPAVEGILKNYPDGSLDGDLLNLFTHLINNYPARVADSKKALVRVRICCIVGITNDLFFFLFVAVCLGQDEIG